MTKSERIHEKLRGLPEPVQKEVLHEEWSQLSIAAALRGLEEEKCPQYNEGDLKEKWQ